MISERANIIRAIRAANELLNRRSQNNFATFVKRINPNYDMQDFHAYICKRLDEFERGHIKNMMILLPVQHGKSELASRLFPPYLLGKNPDRRIGLITYNDTFARKFNRQVQRNMSGKMYTDIFPNTRLSGSNVVQEVDSDYARNQHEFEIVNHLGGMVTLGRGGQINGLPIDILLMDDLYKNREEAISVLVAEKIWQDYNDVFKTRLHNNSQQLIMNTRWSDQDLAGRLLETEYNNWEVIKFPAIKTADINDYDPRAEGEALWPARHSLERLLAAEKNNNVTFNSLYQQDPKPNADILVYGKKPWIEIPEWPKELDGFTWGLDFGKTTGINALVKCCLRPEQAYFDEHLYEPGVPAKVIAELLKANGYKEGEIVWCDHMPTKIAELRMHGIAAFKAIKGAGSITFGIDKLKELTCYYTARSRNIKMELNSYQYVTYGKIITNEPVDDFNHLMDACRYGTVSRFFQTAGNG